MSSRVGVAATVFVAFAALGAPSPCAAREGGEILGSREAIAAALENNPTLRAAVLNEEQAGAAVRAEEGLYPLMLQLDGGFTHASSPRVDTNGSIAHSSSDTTVLGAQISKTFPVGTEASVRVQGNQQLPGADGPGYGLAARLGLTQPLLRGAGKTVVQSSWRQAVQAENIAALRSRRVASEVALNVLDTYWELWYSLRALEIEQRARDLARTQLEEAEARVEQGDTAPVEALPFQTRLATLEESVVAARASRDNLSVQLAGAIGFASRRDRVMADAGESPDIAGPIPAERKAVARALESSPEVREQLASIALAEERERTAGEQMRARLDMMGWLEANTLGNGEVSPAFSQFGQGEAYSAYVGLVYELPLDDTRKEAQRASARLDVDIASQQLVATRDSIRSQVMTVMETISSAKVRLELAERTLDVARRQAEAERERYELGAAIFVEVREAEESVREADLRTVRARVDLVQARLQLEHLTGELMENFGDPYGNGEE